MQSQNPNIVGSSINAEAKKLGIDFLVHFGFREFRKDGTTNGLSSNEVWNRTVGNLLDRPETRRHYFNELMTVIYQDFRYILRTRDMANNSFLRHLIDFEMETSLILYRKEPEVIKSYHFMVHYLNSYAVSFFVNNLVIFEQLIDRIDPIIHEDEKLQEAFQGSVNLFSNSEVAQLFYDKEKRGRTDRRRILLEDKVYIFTPKELKILEMIGLGGTAKEIASRLSISYRTVEWHIKNIKEKIGTRRKATIVELAKKAKLIY